MRKMISDAHGVVKLLWEHQERMLEASEHSVEASSYYVWINYEMLYIFPLSKQPLALFI